MIFTYKNLKGEISQHQISNPNCDGIYLGAHVQHGYITYRLDRIIKFIPDENDHEYGTITKASEIKVNKVFIDQCKKKNQIQVYFSLFSSKERELKKELINLAINNGMTVMSGMGPCLNYLCTGSKPVPSNYIKLAKAHQQGTIVFSNLEDFIELIKSGALPK